MTFVTPVRRQVSVPNGKHTFLLLHTRDEHAYLRASVLTFKKVDIIGELQICLT